MDEQTEDNGPIKRAPRAGNKIWVFALVILCAGIIFYGIFFSDNTTDNVAVLLGKHLVNTIFIFAAFLVVFLRNKKSRFQATALVAIYGSLMIANLIAASQNKAALKTMAETIGSDVMSIQEQLGAPENANVPFAPPVGDLDTAKTDEELLVEFNRQSMSQIVKVRNSYVSDLQAIGWNDALNPARLKSDPNLVESRAIVSQAKDVWKNHKAMMLDVFDQAVTTARGLNFKKLDKEEFLQAYEKSLSEGRKSNAQRWNMEWEALIKAEELIEVLDQSQGWSVEDGLIIFESDRDVERYQATLAQLRNVMAREQEAQSQLADQLHRKVEELKDF